MKKLFLVLVIPLLMGAGCNMTKTQPVINNAQEELPLNTNQEASSEDVIVEEEDFDYDEVEYYGDLVDVSGGQSSGFALAYFNGQEYKLIAEFDDLPDLELGYFYEGWVVRNEPFDFISTGVATKSTHPNSDAYENIFEDTRDLLDYNLYVLTLEPDDGDPAPAKHIVEGTLNLEN